MIDKKFITLLVLACIPMLLGVSVIVGWHINSQALVQVFPSFAPMQYNTALGFLFSGLGVILLARKNSTAASFFGLIVSALGALTLLQYVFGLDFYIDQMLMEHSITTKTSHPGRMAPNTALCFLLSGLAFINTKFHKQMLLGMGGAVFILSILALMGYVTDQENIYGWGTLIRMAIHTAIGFIVLGSALFYLGYKEERANDMDLWNLAPFTLSAVAIALTIFAWYGLRENAQIRNQEYFDTLVSDMEGNLIDRFNLYQQALSGGVGVFYASKTVEREEWKHYVEALEVETNLPGISGMGYVDYVENPDLVDYLENVRKDGQPNFINYPNTTYRDKFIIRFIEPEEINEKAIGLDIGFEKNRRDAAEHARDYGVSTLTHKIELVQDSKKESGFLLLMPTYNTKKTPNTVGERRAHFQGWVYAPFIGKNFLQELVNDNKPQLDFDVYDGMKSDLNYLIFSSSDAAAENQNSIYKEQRSVNLGERQWTIDWKSSPNIDLPANNNVAVAILLLGIMLSGLLYLALSSLLKGRKITNKEIKKQTRQLRKSKEFLTLIMNSIPDLVSVKDREFNIVRANQAFMDIFPSEERNKIIGHTMIESFSKEEAEVFLAQDKVAFENGVSQTHEEIEIYTGDKINLFSTKVRFTDENNEEYILCISRDVTDLINTQKDLEYKVEERTNEYKKQKILAEQAGNAKEEFLANMSHELRTPLNSIIGLTNILLDEGKFQDDDRETLDIVHRASNSLLKTVNDILDISKIESGNIQLENKSFNLTGLLYSLVDQFKPLASQKGLELRDNLSELDSTFVSADEHRISRVITNLVGNAIKYTENGVVEVTFQVKDDDGDKRDFTINVTDTGVGIPKEQQDGIFDKFSQADKSIERLYGGTGLGLSITKQLVELMLGSIAVESESGKGSTFTVTLPLDKSDKNKAGEDQSYSVASSTEYKESDKIPIENAKILVAEDHEFNQVFVRKILKRLGNDNFKIVENGVDALSEFKTGQYDLVLMDYHMPHMNGYETTQKIRQHEDSLNTGFNTPIIAMTADVMPGTEQKCLKVGMNDYVSKPIDENFLGNKIQKWLKATAQVSKKSNNAPSVKDVAHIDLSLLKDYTDNDLESQKELIEIFYKKSLKDIEILKTYCVDGESKEWVEASHSLKGSSSYIGATSLKNLCAVGQSMQNSSKEDRLDMYKKIKTEHGKICNSLKKCKLL